MAASSRAPLVQDDGAGGLKELVLPPTEELEARLTGVRVELTQRRLGVCSVLAYAAAPVDVLAADIVDIARLTTLEGLLVQALELNVGLHRDLEALRDAIAEAEHPRRFSIVPSGER